MDKKGKETAENLPGAIELLMADHKKVKKLFKQLTTMLTEKSVVNWPIAFVRKF